MLDIDDTFDTVPGHQQLRLFNAYYDEYGFQPIMVFDGEGRLVGTSHARNVAHQAADGNPVSGAEHQRTLWQAFFNPDSR